jgi:two-component system cell cycle sensor histidine kinase/response regulator CckA
LDSTHPELLAQRGEGTEDSRLAPVLRLLGSSRVLAQFPIAVIRLRDRVLVEANDAFTGLFGWSRGESLESSSDPAGGLFATAQARDRAYELLASRGSFLGVELPMRAKSGEQITCLLSAEVAEVEGETYAIGSFQDVSEQRAVDEALRRGETELDLMFDFAPLGFVQADPLTGRILRANRRLAGMLGYTTEELRGMTFTDLTHPDDAGRDLQTFRDLASGDLRDCQVEKRYVHRDGHTVWAKLTATVLRTSSGTPLRTFATIDDITDRKRAEKVQHEIGEQLRAAQKMEAVGRLAGGVAHDFNNLLSVILSYAEVAELGLNAEDPLRSDLNEIVRAAQRAESLTRQLLAFSRRQVLKPESLELNSLVGGVSRMLSRLIGEHIVLEVRAGQGLLQARADRGQIEQVLLNLAVNARDAMPDGGTLTIATALVSLDSTRAAALEIAAGPYLELSVSDTGTGMDEATQARIFEPFFTTKEVGKGTGLGLATVYGIILQSGGGIGVESQPGQGTTFRIYLRHEPGADEECAPASIPAPVIAPRRETILVVEDEEALRNVIRRVLSSAGYKVIVAAGAREALLECMDRGPEVSLVLTDVVMPGMNGRELAERLAPLCPSAKMMFMSGYNDEDIERHDVLGENFLRKPFDRKTLTRKVRGALEGTATPLSS